MSKTESGFFEFGFYFLFEWFSSYTHLWLDEETPNRTMNFDSQKSHLTIIEIRMVKHQTPHKRKNGMLGIP